MMTPSKCLLRRREVLRWLGITEDELRMLTELKVITKIHLRDGSKSYYLTQEIEEKILNKKNGDKENGHLPPRTGAF
jgi:hypothetical protein